jgi:signal transduction histidine kinase
MGSLTRVLERSMGGRGDRERMSLRVEEMADRLAEEEHSRARFVSKVSHELRMPFTAVRVEGRYSGPHTRLVHQDFVRAAVQRCEVRRRAAAGRGRRLLDG